MKTSFTPRRFESDFDRVTRRPWFTLNPLTIVLILMMTAVLVSEVVLPAGKWAWQEFYTSINLPVLTFNKYDRVVKVTEADGTVLTRNAGGRFDKRVQEIKKDGRYDYDFTGRLDGLP